MAVKDQLLDMTPLGMRFTVLRASADTAGQSLDLHWDLLPGCNMKNPLVHMHPAAVETYEVLAGEMEFFVNDRWFRAKAGDQLSVPAGVTHAFRNPSGSVVQVFNTHQPALRMEDYFEDVCKVLDVLTEHRRRAFSMNARTMLYMGALMSRYRAEIIAKSPPDLLIRLCGWLGRVGGVSY